MSFRITQLLTIVVDANLKLIVTFVQIYVHEKFTTFIYPTCQALKIINKQINKKNSFDA